jgi:hypothetical protein
MPTVHNEGPITISMKRGVHTLKLQVAHHDDGLIIQLNDETDLPGFFLQDAPGSNDYTQQLEGKLQPGRNYLYIICWNHEQSAALDYTLECPELPFHHAFQGQEGWPIGGMFYYTVFHIDFS